MILGLIFEIFGEIILQLLFETGFVALAEPFVDRSVRNPGLAVLGSCLLGAIAGGLSLLIAAKHFIHDPQLQFVNIVVTPILVGLVIGKLGAIKREKGGATIHLDTFFHGYLFALVMALIRWRWTV